MAGKYILVKLETDDFFYPMIMNRKSHKGYIQEHRLIMAQHIKRCLLPWEVVHHKNGITTDNRIENLSLMGCQTDHLPSIFLKREFNKQQKEIEVLKSRVTILEAENTVLKAQGVR